MKQLKNDTVNTCVSLLREYIEKTSLNTKKETAILALNQLHAITAGTDSQSDVLTCHGRPMVDGSPDQG